MLPGSIADAPGYEPEDFITACTGSPPRLVFSAAAILPVYALTVAAAAQGHAPALFSAAVLPAALLLKLRHWPESLFSASSAFDRSPLHSHSVWHLLVWAVQAGYLELFERALRGTGSAEGACATNGRACWYLK
uniref:Uncharacterized protein n=2 Tax=Emiliania huxleyi TaxID=2903 RepID=A0A7S3RQ04_EMIHU